MNYNRNYRFCNVINVNVFTFILILLYLFLPSGVFALEELTNDQIISAQNNGMISAMCYVLGMVTGSFGRSIMAVFVVGTGWLFLVGAVKDWKTVFFFSLAVTITYGAAEFANILSGNNYSCKKIYDAVEIDRNTIYNGGDCRIVDIEQYVPGQQWYTCSSYDTNKCEELITDDTTINVGDVVGLKTCEEGSFKKDESVMLTYKCSETTANGEKVNKFVITNQSALEKGRCYPSCSLKSLKQILSGRNAKSSSPKSGAYIILDNSGSLKEGSYFTSGSIIDLDCNAGYIEYNRDGNTDVKGLKAICEGNNVFNLEGICRTKCRIGSTKYKDSVSAWQKYDTNSKSWKDVVEADFYYGEKIRIKTCDEHAGYSFATKKDLAGKEIPINDEEKLVLSCGEGGAWNQELTNDGKIGKVCSKNCYIEKYKYYSTNIWKTDCNNNDECQTAIKEGTIFKDGDVVGVDSCPDKDYTVFSSKDVKKLRLTCSASGSWIEDNGERCHKRCDVSEITNFEFAKTWVECDERGNSSGVGKVSCKAVLKNALSKIFEHNISLKQGSCADGYDINVNTATTFICKDGNFIKKSGAKNEVCRRACRLSMLEQFDRNGLVWFKSNSNGSKYSSDDLDIINLDNIKNAESSGNKNIKTTANYGDYYTLRSCRNDSMSVFSSGAIIALCGDDGEWKAYKNENNYCYVGCDLGEFNEISEWSVYSDEFKKYKTLLKNSSDKFIISNGDKVIPTACRDANSSINSAINSSFYIQCKNGILGKSKNVELCYRHCSLSQPIINGVHSVSEWLNVSTNEVVDKTGSIAHGSKLAVSKCSDGFNLKNHYATFTCSDGVFYDVSNNNIADVCVRN